MNGFIKRILAGLCLGSGMFSLSGCYTYRYLVDPCYPERYNFMARQSVLQATNNQAYNGHVLDQTVWNYFFEKDTKNNPTAELNALGREQLAYMARRRPFPDAKVYLQTAQDVPFDAALGAERFAQARAELDNRRLQSVHKFLLAQTAGRHLGFDFQITVHDPGDISIEGIPIGGNQPATAYRVFGATPILNGNFTGILPMSTGAAGSTGGLGGGGGGAGGGAGGGGGMGGGGIGGR
jgi:hypothetical protein